MNVARSLAVSGTRSRASSRKEQSSREGHTEMFTIQIQQPQSQLKTVSAKIPGSQHLPIRRARSRRCRRLHSVALWDEGKPCRETFETHVTPDV